MDPIKTGRLICERRKALHMTQKELAKKLYITDKAISKWERGLSFPDISTLIPLTEILNLNLYDLLKGESMNKEEMEQTLKNTIQYSTEEIKKTKRKYIRIGFVLFGTLLILFVMYQFALNLEMPVKYKEGLINVTIPVDEGIDIYVGLPNYTRTSSVLIKTDEDNYELYINVTQTLMTKLVKDHGILGNFLRVSDTIIKDYQSSDVTSIENGADCIKRIYYVNQKLDEKNVDKNKLMHADKVLIWERN